MMVLQLPGFSKEGIWDGKELWAQPRIGLAGQRVAGLFFFGHSSLPFFQNCVVLYLMFSFVN